MRNYYQNQETHLTLSDKAEYVFMSTDPLSIEEVYNGCDDEGRPSYLYNIEGAISERDLTEDQVSQALEAYWDGAQYAIEEEYWPLWGENVDGNTRISCAELWELSAEWTEPIDYLMKQLYPV